MPDTCYKAKTCKYSLWIANSEHGYVCDYIGATGHRRPRADGTLGLGDDCTVFEPKRRKKPGEALRGRKNEKAL